MLFVRNGEGEGVGASGWSSAQCWVPCSLTFFVSPRPVRGTVGVVTLQLSHQGRRRDDTSCELFHIWAIINHRLRLGAETARGDPVVLLICLYSHHISNRPRRCKKARNPSSFAEQIESNASMLPAFD